MAWLSTSDDSAGVVDTETSFSSQGVTFGLEMTGLSMTSGSLRVSVELNWDKVMMENLLNKMKTTLDVSTDTNY